MCCWRGSDMAPTWLRRVGSGDDGARAPMVAGALRHGDANDWYQGQEEVMVNLMRRFSVTRREGVAGGEVEGNDEVWLSTKKVFRRSSTRAGACTRWPTRW